MIKTLAFDIYGTLIDTNGVTTALEDIIGKDKAVVFANLWRDKQLEYAFRRGLMNDYQPFSECIRTAMLYSIEFLGVEIADNQQQELLTCYKTLPAFADVESSLVSLQKAGHALYAFSNGTRAAVDSLLQTAGISEYFLDIVSVDEIKTLKPDPDVYRHFCKRANAKAEDCWLISSNPFDVLGAANTGFQSAWLKRSSQSIFDPWGVEPTLTISELNQLAELI